MAQELHAARSSSSSSAATPWSTTPCKRAFAEDMVYLRYAGLHPVVVHGGGPQISAALDGRRHRERLPRRLPVHEHRGHRRRPRRARRRGQPRDRRPHQRARRPRPRRLGRGLRRCSRAAGAASSSTARRSTSATSATSSRCDPTPSSTRSRRAASRSCRRSRRTRRDDRARPLNVNADAAAAALAVALGAAQARRAHRRRRASTPTGPTATRSSRPSSRVGAHRAAAVARVGHDPEDDRLPRRRRRRRRGATIIDGRIPHSILLEVFTQQRLRHRGRPRRRRVGTRRHRPATPDRRHRAGRTVVTTTQTQDGTWQRRFGDSLMRPVHPEGDARARRGLRGLGRRRQALPRLPRRHRGQRPRPRAPGARRGGHRPGRARSSTSRTTSRPPPQLELAERLVAHHGRRRPRPRLLRQLAAPRPTRRRSSSRG